MIHHRQISNFYLSLPLLLSKYLAYAHTTQRRALLASKLGKLARHAANHDSLHLPPLSYSIFHGLISTHACRQQRDTRIHLSRRTAAAHGHGTPSSRTSGQPGQKPETCCKATLPSTCAIPSPLRHHHRKSACARAVPSPSRAARRAKAAPAAGHWGACPPRLFTAAAPPPRRACCAATSAPPLRSAKPTSRRLATVAAINGGG